MAIDYTGTGGLFARFGALMRTFLAFEAQQLAGSGTIPDLRDDVLAEYAAAPEQVSGLYAQFAAMAASVDDWKRTLVSDMEALLPALADELDAPDATVATIWPLFLARLAADDQTVKANAVAIGAITPGAANSGDGLLVVLADNVLGDPVETLIPESLRVACVSAESAGAETFQISGEVPAPSTASSAHRGTGRGATVNVANSTDNLLTNADFENFTADGPDGWTVVAGTASVHILKLAASPFRGAGSLKLIGDGVASAITISQAFASGAVSPRTRYACGCWIKASGLTAATITVKAYGTGFDPGAQKIAITTAYPAAWAFYSFFVDTPAVVPADFRLEISGGSVETGGIVLVDALAFVRASVHYGLSWAVFAGADRFVSGDHWAFSVTNDEAGKFQTLFGRLFNMQLPSTDADDETIPDTLITG